MSDEKPQPEDQPQDLTSRLKRLEDLVENAADAIFLGNPQGVITYSNRAAVELCGFSSSELTGRNISTLFCDTELEQAPLRYDLLLQGVTVKTERLLKRKDGTKVAIEMNSRRLSDGTFHTFIRDVSARKKIELALRLSEEKFSRAFKLSPDAININRLSDGTYIAINQGFTSTMGWTEEEVIGRKSLPGELDIWCQPEDRQRLVETLKKSGEVTGFEAPFRSKDGGIIFGQMSARIMEINGKACILSITRDMTEKINTQKAQREAEEKFQQARKLESLGLLAGGLAHDFNNILAGLYGNVSLAKSRLTRTLPDHPSIRYLKAAENSMNRATALTNQLLTFSKGGAPVKETLSLSRLIDQVISFNLSGSNVKPVISHPDDLWLANVDQGQIQQVFGNLTINAKQAMPEGGELLIRLENAEIHDNQLQGLAGGNYILISLTDGGTGIKPEHLERIFDPYFTTKQTGNGLGLATVYSIIQKHGGHISVASQLGLGTTFSIFLPSAEIQALPIQPVAKIAASWQQAARILVMDDEQTICDIVKDLLEDVGYNVETVANGTLALDRYRQTLDTGMPFDLVILDLTIPGGTGGEEVVKQILALHPQAKVIVSSGYADDPVIANYRDYGFKGVAETLQSRCVGGSREKGLDERSHLIEHICNLMNIHEDLKVQFNPRKLTTVFTQAMFQFINK